MKAKKITWETADDLLKIEYQPLQGQYVAKIQIIWQQTPNAPYTVMATNYNATIPLDHIYPGGARLRGYLKYVEISAQQHSLGLWGDFHYGEHEFSHFEGVMFLVDGSGGDDPIDPPIDPKDPSEEVVPPDGPEIITPPVRPNGSQSDLFPYVYMRYWPEITDAQKSLNFITYNDAITPPPAYASFYDTLKQLRANPTQHTRMDMSELAVSFIEGDGPWAGGFVGTWPPTDPIGESIQTVLTALQSLSEPTPAEVITAIEAATDLTLVEVKGWLVTQPVQDWVSRVWQSYFALVIVTGYRTRLLEHLVEALRIVHLIQWVAQATPGTLSSAMLEDLLNGTIILPADVFPLPPAIKAPPTTPPGSDFANGWIEPYAIGELKMTRQKAAGYEAGEVARVINVLKGECKKVLRSTRSMVHQKTFTEEQTQDCDTQTREDLRNDLTAEVLKTLAGSNRDMTYNNFDTSYGPPATVTYNNGWTQTTSPGDPGIRNTTEFAREIIEKAVQRISRSVAATKSRTTLDESEEQESSVLDNTHGTTNLVAVYRWLNRVYSLSVVNYGNRLMIEFLLKDPARAYIARERAFQGEEAKRPAPLAKRGILTYQDIQPANYPQLVSEYKIRQPIAPPVASKIASGVFVGNAESEIEIPEGYLAQSAKVSSVYPEKASLEGLIGNQPFAFPSSGGDTLSVTLSEQDAAVPVVILATLPTPPADPPTTPAAGAGKTKTPPLHLKHPTSYFKVMTTVEVTCALADHRLDQWRIKAYEQLQAAYDAQAKDYFDTYGGPESDARQRSGTANRLIEATELQKGAFSLLFERYFQLVGPAPTVPPSPSPTIFAVNEPRYLQFFRTAFEWDEMTYAFFTNMPTGQPLLPLGQIGGYQDPLFTNFLQASSARVMVPVSPGMSLSVLYFLASGCLWVGEDAKAPTFDDDLHVVNELKKIEAPNRQAQEEGNPWQIVVPTTMQVLAETSHTQLLQVQGDVSGGNT